MTRKQAYCDSPYSLRALARQLRTTNAQLKFVAGNAQRMYRYNPQMKVDKVRDTYDPHPPLKALQQAIDTYVLKRVPLPAYVQGGASGASPLTNATIHAGKQRLVRIDIDDFFPSVTQKRIYSLFTRMGFGSNLSGLLTSLTTYEGTLPQGAPTSTSLANLLLLPLDARVADIVHNQGYGYSRFIDDIAISGDYPDQFIGLVVNEIQKLGLRSSKKKLSWRSRGHRKGQVITGYTLNSGSPSVSKKYRDKVRAQIQQLQHVTKDQFSRECDSIRGKIAYIKKTNPGSAQRLSDQLETRLALA